MNKNIPLYLFLSILFFMTSCKVMSLRNYESLLSIQDSLSNGWNEANLRANQLENERDNLMCDTASLYKQLTNLKGNLSSSSGRVAQLSVDLAAREQRLKECEEILRKRDEESEALTNNIQQHLLVRKRAVKGKS